MHQPPIPEQLPAPPPAEEVLAARETIWFWVAEVDDWRTADLTARWRSPEGRWAVRLCNVYLSAPGWPGKWFWADTTATRPS